MQNKIHCERCWNKTNYETYEEALDAVSRVESRLHYSKKPGKLEPYKCPYSDYWHLGHRIK